MLTLISSPKIIYVNLKSIFFLKTKKSFERHLVTTEEKLRAQIKEELLEVRKEILLNIDDRVVARAE